MMINDETCREMCPYYRIADDGGGHVDEWCEGTAVSVDELPTDCPRKELFKQMVFTEACTGGCPYYKVEDGGVGTYCGYGYEDEPTEELPKECPVYGVGDVLESPGITAKCKLTTNVKITVLDLDGNIKDVQEIKNLLTTVGLNMIRDGLAGDVSDFETKYTAVGSDNTAPALADTTLGTETFRKATTSSNKPADAQFRHVVYIAPAEAVGAIEEIGWFCGAAAGAGADSGILLSRVLYSRTKTALESIQVERTDTFAEA